MKATGRRRLAGAIVRDEIARQGQTQAWAAEQMGIASSSLHSVILGESGATSSKLRCVAGALGLPRRLLTSVVDGDTALIRAIGDDEMPSGLRQSVLESLTTIDEGSVEQGRTGLPVVRLRNGLAVVAHARVDRADVVGDREAAV